MKASELRIGNLSERINKTTDEKMTIELTASCILDISSNGNNSSFVYKPIPLTEEWLLKFGFEKDEELGYRWYLGYNRTTILVYDLDDKCIKVSETWEFGTREYVHQLQNLFHALTNEELTYEQQK